MIYCYAYWRPNSDFALADSNSDSAWPAGIEGAAAVQSCILPIAGDDGEAASSNSQRAKPRLLYSHVPAELFRGPIADLRLENAAWVGAAALSHHEVIIAAHAAGAVLPLRWGTVFETLAAAQGPFLLHARQWSALLDQVQNCEECELQLHCQQDRLRELWLEKHQHTWAKLPAGRRYLAERAALRQFESHLEDQCLAAWSRLEGDLLPLQQLGQCRAKAIRRPTNRVYLVQRYCKEFSAVVEMRNELEDGFHFEFAGNWPPYSFASLGQWQSPQTEAKTESETEAQTESETEAETVAAQGRQVFSA